MPSFAHPHARQYAREDVERMRQRTEQRRDPQKAVDGALHWGMPLLESSITLVANGHLYYRGHDACELATTKTVEEVASLIWFGHFGRRFGKSLIPVRPKTGRATRLSFIGRAQSVLPAAAATDPLALDFRPNAVAETGWRILNLLVGIAASASSVTTSIDETLRRVWAPRNHSAARLLRAALILSADHELNVSSFTARCVASAGADPYMVVQAGLAALEGWKHGGMTRRIETIFNEVRDQSNVRQAITERLRRGERLHGFAHPLYENGDPRARLLLSLIKRSLPRTREIKLVQEIAKSCESVAGGEKPTLDFALVALVHALGLPNDSALTIFALGRTIGWIGHAIEQYSRDEIIRPRARYVGVMPSAGS
jgi:citrate synthase